VTVDILRRNERLHVKFKRRPAREIQPSQFPPVGQYCLFINFSVLFLAVITCEICWSLWQR